MPTLRRSTASADVISLSATAPARRRQAFEPGYDTPCMVFLPPPMTEKTSFSPRAISRVAGSSARCHRTCPCRQVSCAPTRHALRSALHLPVLFKNRRTLHCDKNGKILTKKDQTYRPKPPQPIEA